MEHDTRKTFRQIHGTPSALVAELERIEQFALRRFQTPRNTPHPIKLRFLAPLNPQPERVGKGAVHLRLTAASEHKSEDEYVAVSYTWQQDEALIDAFRDSIPAYKICESGSEWRAPRCNPIVLHRAYMYAQARLKKVRIWIDQECIEQDNPEDVEMHVQAMHEIYRRSAFTIVLLSSMVDSVHVAAGLFPFLQGRDDILDEMLSNEDCRGRAHCHRALEYLSQDRWFTRTWTYQERFFASVCHYVVTLSPTLRSGEDPSTPAILEDWCIPESHIERLEKKIFDLEIGGKVHLRLSLHSLTGEGCTCIFSLMGIARLIKLSFAASRSNNHKIHLPGFENVGLTSVGFSTFAEESKREYGPAEQERDVIHGRFETVNAVFTAMEACGNAVVSDRISIFANICQFEWTLQAVRFREEKASYSSCILTLLLLDVLKRNDLDFKERLAGAVMDMTVIDYIRSQLFPCSKAMYRSNYFDYV